MGRRILCFLILAILGCMARQVIGGIEWPSDPVRLWFASHGENNGAGFAGRIRLSDGDKEAILWLAKEIGIEDPVRVSDRACRPRICDFLVVESAAKELGHLKCWLELKIHPEDWSADDGSITLRAGRWAAQRSELIVEERWIIEDDGWRLYVFLSPYAPFDVPFEDAELIVLAIRHDKLINRHLDNRIPQSQSFLHISKIDPSSIAHAPVGASTYDVYTLTGTHRGGFHYQNRQRKG
jgi:hypothetical protein